MSAYLQIEEAALETGLELRAREPIIGLDNRAIDLRLEDLVDEMQLAAAPHAGQRRLRLHGPVPLSPQTQDGGVGLILHKIRVL